MILDEGLNRRCFDQPLPKGFQMRSHPRVHIRSVGFNWTVELLRKSHVKIITLRIITQVLSVGEPYLRIIIHCVQYLKSLSADQTVVWVWVQDDAVLTAVLFGPKEQVAHSTQSLQVADDRYASLDFAIRCGVDVVQNFVG